MPIFPVKSLSNVSEGNAKIRGLPPCRQWKLQHCCRCRMPTPMIPGARWQMSTPGMHLKMPHARSFRMGDHYPALSNICFFSLSQNAQSFSMNCKVIGQCCSFLSVGHSRKGHHPPQARQMKQASRVICAHTMHLANTPNPTLQSCFMVFNLKIADSLSKKEHLELCWWQSTSMTSENIS